MRRLLTLLYVFILSVCFSINFFRPITAINYDLGRQILLGSIIRETMAIPATNLLSYTYTSYPFINSSWLSSVFFSVLVDIGGFDFLQIVSFFIVLVAIVFQVGYTLKHFSRAAILAVATLLIFPLITRSEIRPEIFSMLFMSLFMVVLYRYKKTPNKLVYLLIPFEALWVNMHVYFFVGIILIVFFILEDLILSRGKIRNSTKSLVLVLLLSSLATLLNPNGMTGALFPLLGFQNYGAPITENQNFYVFYELYKSGSVFILPGVICLFWIVLLICRKHARPVDWMIALFFGVAAMVIVRNILLFIFIAFIPFVANVDFFIKKYVCHLGRQFYLSFVILYLSCSSLLIAYSVVAVEQRGVGFGVREYGRGVTDFIIRNKIKGPLFNDLNIGGYLTYRVYPELVYVDNRPEAYPAGFFQNIYIPMDSDTKIFDKQDAKYSFNVLILLHFDDTFYHNKLLTYLVNNPRYRLVYLDSYCLALVKNSPENQTIINKYRISSEDLKLETVSDRRELIRYLYFFKKVQWDDKADEAKNRMTRLVSRTTMLPGK